MNKLRQFLCVLVAVLCLAGVGWSQAPSIGAGGVVNAADYTQSFSPGIMISIFGSDLAPVTELAQGVPLPTVLAGVTVEVTAGGTMVEAPLFFVSPGQINAQLPYGITGQAQVRVTSGGGSSGAETIEVDAASPRLYTQTMDGLGQAILVHSDYTVVTPENPARAGEWVVLYLTGLGEVTPAIAAGQAGGDGGSGGDLNRVAGNVELLVNRAPANVYFAGLAPYFVGLYQINFQVPENSAPGMTDITVRLAGENSQADVKFGCAVGYEQLASQTVGSGGGTVGASGFSVEIPAGAMPSDAEITVHRVTGGTDVSRSTDDPVFALEGIPSGYQGNMTVTFEVPGEAPVAGEGRLVLIEDGGTGGETIAETEVNGSTVTAAVELGGAAGAATTGAASRRTASYDAANQGVQLWLYVRKLGHQLSPSGHFDVWFNDREVHPLSAAAAGNSLDWVETKILEMGYRWKEGAQFPISVTMTKSSAPGSVKRNGRDNTLTLRLYDYDDSFNFQKKRQLWATLLLGLFHMQHDLDARFDGLGAITPWTWWHVASQQYLSESIGLVPPGGLPSDRRTDFLFLGPLQVPAAGGSAPSSAVERHAIGAVNFLDDLSRRLLPGWQQAVLDNWAPDNAPIDAAIAGGLDITGEWLKFCQSFSEGKFKAFVPEESNTARTMTKTSLNNAYRLDQEDSLPKTVTWSNSQDLMAAAYRFNIVHGWPSGTSLMVRLPGSSSDIVARVFEDRDPNGSASPRFIEEFSGGETLEIPDLDQYQASSLVVMLINKRAVRPYNGVTPVQLRLEAKGAGDVSEVVGWLRECKKVIVSLWGVEGTCRDASGNSHGCGFGNITIRSWVNNTDKLLPIEWDGENFSFNGALDTGWERPVRIEHTGGGMMSADGLTSYGGTFSDISIYDDGMKIYRTLQLSGPLPWDGFNRPRERDKSYTFQVKGPQAVQALVGRTSYKVYDGAGKLAEEMTSLDYTSDNAYLLVRFERE